MTSLPLAGAAQVLLFEVAGHPFAFSTASVREVVRAAWPAPLPRAPFGVLGALDVRGERVPLVHLGAALGLSIPPRREALAEHLLDAHFVITSGPAAIAFVVDRVLDLSEERATEGHARGEAAPHPHADDLPNFSVGGPVIGVCGPTARRASLLDPARIVGAGRRRLIARAVTQGAAAP